MIDSMFQDRIDANLDDQVKRPSTMPAPSAGVWRNFLGGAGGIVAGGFNAAAGEADQVGGFGQVMAAGGSMSAGGMFSLQSDEELKQSNAARDKLMSQGVDLTLGDPLRAKAKAFMPDPQTTGQAGQILAGLGDFGSQAMVAGVAGPAGLVNLSVNRGLQRSDELKQQGVDFNTRTAVGAVSGATDAASMLLPMSGASALIRAGKGAAGGFASSVVSTEAEKLILEHQGYDKIASTMDPFDPVSLALSALVPAGFGAAFGHGAPASAHVTGEAAGGVPMPDGITSDTSSAAQALRLNQDIVNLKTELARPGLADDARAVLQSELDHRTSEAAAVGAAQDPNAVAAARTQQAARALDSARLTPDDDLAGYQRHQDAVETAADQIASGRPAEVSDIVQAPPLVEGASPRLGDFGAAVDAVRADRASDAVATKPDHAAFEAARAESEAGTAPPQREAGAAPAAGDGPDAGHLAAQAAEIARLNPDMVVHLEGMEPMRVADLMEHFAAEAQDTKRDSSLVQVAAQCALSFGAT